MEPTLFVCVNRRLGTAGACDGQALAEGLRAELQGRGLDWTVLASPCMGHCGEGPNVKAAPGGPMLHNCPKEGAAGVVEALLAAGWPTR